MSACNDCWDEAFKRAQIGGGHQAEHYEAILLLPPKERPWCAFARGLEPAGGRERMTTEPTYGMCLACLSIEVALVEATGTRDFSGIGESANYPTGYGCEVCA